MTVHREFINAKVLQAQAMGASVDPVVDELADMGALFVVNHSGGKDSQAMLIRLLQRIPAKQMVVIHAALGEVEWEGALELAQKQAKDAGVTFLVARSVKTFFQMVEHRFKVRPGPNSPCWPSAANRQCTSDLKRGPIQREARRYAKDHGFSIVVSCLGIRAQESPGRAQQIALRLNDRCGTKARTWYDWLPIHSMKRDEVFRTIRAAGQEPHWAYAQGNDRLSCVFCILGSAKDIANGAKHRPDLVAKYIEIEDRTGYTMHQSRKPLKQLIEEGSR